MPTETHAFVPPEPHHMAALIPEMSLIFALESADEKELPEYSDEVEAYVAAALAHHGFCCAPDELSFCQDRLDKLVTGHTCERSKKLDAPKEAESKDSTPSENIQTHRYEETCEYVKERLARNLKALQRLA